MSSSDIVIELRKVSKKYKIYSDPKHRLKQFISSGLSFFSDVKKKYYKDFWALNNISFKVRKGETVGIIGKNGSGKSTLLQLISGILTSSSGVIITKGRIASLLELGSGFDPEFTGRENVYLSASLLGLNKKQINKKFKEIVEFSGISEFIDQPVKTYSSGMFVRLAFSVNLLCEPDILIIDEALAVGDIEFQAKCMTALKNIQKKGITIIFVSHDISAIKSLCDKCLLLDRGRLVDYGSAPDIAEKYIKNTRLSINSINSHKHEETLNFEKSIKGGIKPLKIVKKKSIEEFEKKFSAARYGTGFAQVKYAELFDINMNNIRSAEFGQDVILKIYIEAMKTVDISCIYYIMDDKKNLILGSGFGLLDHPLIQTVAGGKYLVTYKTTLPLLDGNYSIQLQLTTPPTQDIGVIFHDTIDDVILFTVNKRDKVPIWSKVNIPNEVEVLSC